MPIVAKCEANDCTVEVEADRMSYTGQHQGTIISVIGLGGERGCAMLTREGVLQLIRLLADSL